MIVFVGQQQELWMLPLILHAIKNWINVKVSIPSYITILTNLEIGCVPTLNLLSLDSKQKLVQKCGIQQ
jgi:hypothetical protein